MKLEILKSDVSDNYFYVVADDEGRAAVIDPVDAATTIERFERGDLKLVWVVNTHFHHDHVAGDDAVLNRFSDARLCAGPDHHNISTEHDFDLILSGGDTLDVGDLSLSVIDTPGHTPGHISLLIDNALFSGDTIFVGGAGNCSFGGDPSILYRTFRDVLPKIGGDVTFYPGHDYARRNVEFALSLEPDHDVANAMLERIEQHSGGIFLTTLAEERSYNPFLRWDDASLRTALRERHAAVWDAERASSEEDGEATFRTVRALRNNW